LPYLTANICFKLPSSQVYVLEQKTLQKVQVACLLRMFDDVRSALLKSPLGERAPRDADLIR
jgi:hypothetical protein